ncbi:hypothetical protein BKA62DRAFT_709581 [Auriculariales sp. MPI-PUGE-AT-0066]|nr:hypothetical protein BKA62DRAFT_709581 [Auriculariales sp. MPI-PUGE-AT-0066]
MRRRHAVVALLCVAAHSVYGLEITTPWNVTVPTAESIVFAGSATSQSLMFTDNLLAFVQIQFVLTALWGVFSVGLDRPRRWNPQRTRARARTRYDIEKDQVFLENKRGEIQPVHNLERLATVTSDLDDAILEQLPSSSQMPMQTICHAEDIVHVEDGPGQRSEALSAKRCGNTVSLLSVITTVKFGFTLGTAIAALPTVIQLGIGIWLRSRSGGACPHQPRIAGWSLRLSSPLRPSRILAPVIAILALGVQCLWNGSLMISLGALAIPPGPSGPLSIAAGCIPPKTLLKMSGGRIIIGILIECFTMAATVMFAMHIRRRKRDVDEGVPISRLGLSILACILIALQSVRAPIITAAFPNRSSLADALRCAVDARGLDGAYAFGRFMSLL